MNADHFFAIGRPHQMQGVPCEDYALSGVFPSGVAYGVVCDGCSGAQASTDVGARALAYAARDTLARVTSPAEGYPEEFLNDLKAVFSRNQYTGRPDDYLATLVALTATPDHAAAFVFGDGAIALRYADGRHQLIEFSWWDNMPFYLQYGVGLPDGLADFTRRYADGVIEPFSIKKTTFIERNSGLETVDKSVEWQSFDTAYDGYHFHARPAEEGIVAMAVMTDGIFRIGEQAPDAVVNAFLGFKNHQGSFVKRRLLKALDVFARTGDQPQDDVAVAAIWFGEDDK